MKHFFYINGSTLIIGGLVAAAVIAIIFQSIKKRKTGKTSCGCGCSECALAGQCHQVKTDKV